MRLPAALLVLKQHRFEVATACAVAVGLGMVALWVNAKLVGLAVPEACLDAWRRGAGLGPACQGQMAAFMQISDDEAGRILTAMAILPFAAGLLAGVPLVGRELETRTAQTAWALAPSRRLWMARQLWPILIVVGGTVTFAALAASSLEAARLDLRPYPLADLGLHGPLVVARSLAVLGLGVLSGAALGRTLPAFIVGALVSVLLLVAAAGAQQVWMAAQPLVEFDAATESDARVEGKVLERTWRGPDGHELDEVAAVALAQGSGTEDPYAWLQSHDYVSVPRGLTYDTLRTWEPIEATGFAILGLAFILGSVAVVDRRRPT